MARLYVLMGVSGSGKTSIGKGVAEALGATYVDGDDYHPEANLAKMRSGTPLNDDDRWPWLAEVGAQLASIDGVGLIGCSALKRSYRDLIRQVAAEPVQFLFLSGSKALLAERTGARRGHFMPASLLDSQFDALEIPQKDENAITVDIDATPEQIVAFIVGKIQKT